MRKNPKVKLQMTAQPRPYLESIGREEVARSANFSKTRKGLLRGATDFFADSFKELEGLEDQGSNDNEFLIQGRLDDEFDSKEVNATSF